MAVKDYNIMNIAITIYDSIQITHDEWIKKAETKVFPETASIKEINDWISTINPNQNIATCIISRVAEKPNN